MNQTNTHQNLGVEAVSLCLEAYHSLLFGHFRDWFATIYSQTRTVNDDFPARDENGKIIELKKGSFGFSFQSSKSNVEAYFTNIIVPDDYILDSCEIVLSNKTTLNSKGKESEVIEIQMKLIRLRSSDCSISLVFQLIEDENDGKWSNLRFAPSAAIVCTEINSSHGPEGKKIVLL